MVEQAHRFSKQSYEQAGCEQFKLRGEIHEHANKINIMFDYWYNNDKRQDTMGEYRNLNHDDQQTKLKRFFDTAGQYSMEEIERMHPR